MYISVMLPEKLALQRQYIEKMSLRTDLVLILRTLMAIFR
jgi:lipopolysaccharide/colanic/teichoic acid biosynthesis glycosyltransferase